MPFYDDIFYVSLFLIYFNSSWNLQNSKQSSKYAEISLNWFYFQQLINEKWYEIIGSIDFKPIFI